MGVLLARTVGPSVLLFALACGVCSVASAQGYLRRPITLPRGSLRVDLAPPDYGFMDHGLLNDSRGFRVAERAGDNAVSLGSGIGYGAGNDIEIGALALPLEFSPNGDVGDVELYGRLGITRAVALQATVQLPTQTEVGLGIGLPAYISLGSGGRLETGAELEAIFYEDVLLLLDFPLAFQFAVGNNAFLGPRTGVVIRDFDWAGFNLGIQGGVSVGSAVDLSASFNFPRFIQTGDGDTVSLDGWEIIMGVNLYFGG